MGVINSIKTTNFKFDISTPNAAGEVEVRISALIGTEKNPKHGDLLFRFDRLTRNQVKAVAMADLWNYVTSFETRLAQLQALQMPAA